MSNSRRKQDIFTVPNLLSLLRLLLIPVYAALYLRAMEPREYFLAGSILALSCVTDALDGWIARQFHMISEIGKLLDPIADKGTQFAMLLCVGLKHPQLQRLLLGLLGLFIIKECFQLLALILNFRKGLVLPGALWPGKIATCVLFLSMILIVVMPRMPENTMKAILISDGCFLAFSFASYALTYWAGRERLRKLPPKES